jgi:hypothetical protein
LARRKNPRSFSSLSSKASIATAGIVEGFIHDEIYYDIPHSKKNSYIPATTSVTLKRGQEILAGD